MNVKDSKIWESIVIIPFVCYPFQHSVQALQLLQLSIEHFLAPNLALLCDTLQGSGMEELGPVIYKKLHDSSWEIRDSALELLTSMVELSKMSKYKDLSFQQERWNWVQTAY